MSQWHLIYGSLGYAACGCLSNTAVAYLHTQILAQLRLVNLDQDRMREWSTGEDITDAKFKTRQHIAAGQGVILVQRIGAGGRMRDYRAAFGID